MLQSQVATFETPREGRFSLAPVLGAFAALAYVAAYLAPNHYAPWVSFHGEAAAFLALILVSGAWLAHGGTLRFSPAIGLFAALIVLVWAQWAGGLIAYHGDAVVSSLYLGGLAVAWFVGVNVARSPAALHRALVVFGSLIVLAAVVSVLIATLQWLRMEQRLGTLAAERMPGGRPFANLAQPNLFATLCLMAIVMTCWLRHAARVRPWQCIALMVFLSFGLVMAQSRAAWASVAVLGMLFAWRVRPAWRLGSRKYVLVWWGGLILAGAVWGPLNEALLLQEPRAVLSLTQDHERLTIWKQMLAAIAHAPWFGYGWRQTVVAQKIGALAVEGRAPTDYAHSVVLDLMLWIGVPLGLLLLCVAAGWLLRALWRADQPVQFFLFAAAWPVLFHSQVEFPFAYAYFLFPVGWLLGALSGTQTTAHFEIAKTWRTRVGAASVLTVFAAVGTWVTVEYLQAEEDHRIMRFEMRSVGRVPQGYEAPSLILLNNLGELLRLARLQPTPGMAPHDLERMRVASLSFEWATLQLRYAVALGLNGQPQEAAAQLQGLRALYGPLSYMQARSFFIELRDTRYPQLKAVELP